jgi:prevent-host-death family protein
MCQVYAWCMSDTDLPVMTTREARDNLADVIDNAAHDKPTIVTRRGRPVAAVVPISMVQRARRYEEAAEEQYLAALIDHSEANPGEPTSLDDVIAETLARTE